MKLYAPKYYQRFACIADRCRHSCCVGWEIDIDEETEQRYATMQEAYGAVIRQSIEREGTPHFRLAEGERCPHLNESGLCRIILNCGQDYLCDICREHPRFYHQTAQGMEVGLGMACEEACRIILASDDYTQSVEIETLDGEAEPSYLDVLAHRDRMYAILSDRTKPYAKRLGELSRLYGVTPASRSDGEWRQRLASLEYLDDAHRALFGCYSSCADTPCTWETVLERALAYWIYRHVSQAQSADELCASVGFSLFCERLLASMICAENAHDFETVVGLARVISEEIEYSEDNTASLRGEFLK